MIEIINKTRIGAFSGILFFALTFPASAFATDATTQIVTSDEVSAYVNIRAEPTVNSTVIGVLGAGMAAPLIGESARWYAIELSGGGTGYVSRYWTEKVSRESGTSTESIDAALAPVVEWQQLGEPSAVAAQVPAELSPVTALSQTESATLAVQASTETSLVTSADPSMDAPPSQTEPATDATSRDRSALAKASALLEQNRPQDAFALLSNLEAQWAGDSGFDYLYGVAALDSGDPVEAIFALERVIRSLPDFSGARLELARALFLDGDRERAEQEFTALMDEQPPEEVRRVIQGYLDALSVTQETPGRAKRVFYAGALGGYDTNANGAADIDSFFGFTLDPRSIEAGSAFAEAQFGGLVRRPLRQNLDFSWQGEIEHRINPSASFADHTLATTALALALRRGSNNFIAGMGAYWSNLDGGFSESSVALDLGWQRALRKNALQLALRAGPVRFGDQQQIRDVDRLLYTLKLRQPFRSGNGELNWIAFGGRDLAVDRELSPYSNTRSGGQIGAKWKVSGNDMRADLGLLKIPYNGNADFFGIEREDQQIVSTVSIELDDKPFRGWTFIPSLRYINNESTVAIFDYDRLEMGFLFRVSQ